jgi:hypothetical protein
VTHRLRAGVSLLALVVLSAGVAACAPRLLNPATLGVQDFVCFWSSARVIDRGGNPWSAQELLPLQNDNGWACTDPIVMWNPPWALSLVMPFGLLDFAGARLLWFALEAALLLFAAAWAWQLYGGPPSGRGLALLLTASFFPCLLVLRMGQLTPFVLLGLLGFLHFERRGEDFRAGLCAALVAVKPHLVYLFWPALLLWAARQRRWAVLAGGVAAGLALSAAPCCCNPHAFACYREALANRPPADVITPTLGAVLRFALGGEKFWLQFVPPAFGVLWFVPHWFARRAGWDWRAEVPALVFVSLLTTCYGAWAYDLVLLLLPLLRAAAWVRARRPEWAAPLVAFHLAVSAAALAMNVCRFDEFWFVWMLPVLFGAYLLCARVGPAAGVRPRGAAAGCGSGGA